MAVVGFASIFLVSGTFHFLRPGPFVRIVPPWLPRPEALVAVSGALELLGALGLLVPATRAFAAWGLVALLVAVFPANIHMAVAGIRFFGAPRWVGWVRLPFQIPLIAWGIWIARF